MGSGGIAPRIQTSAVAGCNWLASRPGRFIPGERAPSTHWIGGLMGARADLVSVARRKKF